MKADQWKPVRKGNIYCSPGCGCGCTWGQYKDAQKNALELAAKMGEGWQPEVDENLGWHYSAKHSSGLAEACECRGIIYVYIGRDGEAQFIGKSRSPGMALKRAADEALAAIGQIEHLLKKAGQWKV